MGLLAGLKAKRGVALASHLRFCFKTELSALLWQLQALNEPRTSSADTDLIP